MVAEGDCNPPTLGLWERHLFGYSKRLRPALFHNIQTSGNIKYLTGTKFITNAMMVQSGTALSNVLDHDVQ